MEILINESEYCKVNVHYEADREQIENKRIEVLSLFKKAPVKGFRDGKANIEVIKIQYKKQIEESLKRALAEEAFHNTMFEKNIKPLGQPDFSNMLLQGNKFSCDFSISRKPDFEIGQYKELEVPKPVRDFTIDELSEKMLEDLRVQYGEMVPYGEDDFVQEGDKIIIAYDGFVNGEKRDDISTEGEMLTVGENQIKEFDLNLLGMKIGEIREFNIVGPENGLPSYNGVTIKFVVNVSMGSKINKIPLDDSLAVKVGKNNFTELREFVNGIAINRLQEADRANLVRQVSAKLVDSHNFEVPAWLCLSEARYLVANLKKNWDSLTDLDKESFLKLAEKNVKLALILDRIRETEPEAQLSDQEVIDLIKQNIAKSNNNSDEVLQNMNKSGYLPVLVARLRDEFTLDFILKTVKELE